ncbi:MAG: WG repeat-containing protein [Bacteroidetes bacterium]|nr:WG repeat-containing protein [Bacteroidota bacterium]
MPSVKKGFEALSMYDYFLAKKQFYKALKKQADAPAAYGLAAIFSRNDNPFYNLDSAAKYASLGYVAFLKKPIKQNIGGFSIDSVSTLALCDTVGFRQWNKIKKSGTVETYNAFLMANYNANPLLREQAVYLRDELEYNACILKNRSDSTREFIHTHPQSAFLQEALLLFQRQVYNEETKEGTSAQLIRFLSKNPSSVMVNTAYENLYKLYQTNSDTSGLSSFVKSYPNAPQNTEAWKLLFSLTVKSFSNHELEKFLRCYPSFPFKESILRELELNKVRLFPYEQQDVYGFIDSTARLVIRPVYDVVSKFSEGLSVVNKNDTVYFINKENMNPFNQFYNEAYPFQNGISAVKQGNKWMFINRQGQVISGGYEEVNELSNQVYVVKINNKYGAINHVGQVIIESRFQKLGDFKNDFAYYIEDGKYGFVSKDGYVHKADFEWISDFNSGGMAIIKKNNVFGLISANGNLVLEPQMDLIVRAAGNTYIVVKNGLYGFYNGNGCYISQIAYDYIKEKPAEYYTNGSAFKLLRKGEQGLIDANGKQTIDFGTYDEINFASNGLIRVKRKKKYGYVDRKLTLVIPYKFDEARDFSDSLAIVTSKEKNALINLQGKEIFSSEEEIEKLSSHFYLTGEDKSEIIDRRGVRIWSGVEDVQMCENSLLIITLSNKEIKLLKD